jgi:hypothetical protein
MRRGALCVLRWSDVNLDLGVPDITRSLVLAPGGLAGKSTKTDRSRKVALDPVGIASSLPTVSESRSESPKPEERSPKTPSSSRRSSKP